RGFEIQLTVAPTVATPAPTSTLAVTATPGAARLGLPPQVSVATAKTGEPAIARIRSLLPGPYALQEGDTLNLVLNGAPLAVAFPRPPDKRGVAWTAADVAAAIAGPQLASYPCFWPRPLVVELTTTQLGPDAVITLGGSALTLAPPTGLMPLGVKARAYHGSAGRSATVT